ncbi:cytosolic sulfotransferase 13-like [Eucalyptus grandis]|uniref:cytosolic sulfotransferase 13-like n=1 Tax=Eucalyptus grandis TaxID=71139 RepID=UPI000527E117|nr:cytosolic sulfotransferase 13-like [Eucalyptus grandis]
MTPTQPQQAKYLQEDDISQKCRDLLPLLPREKGWITTSIYQYQGFWYCPKVLSGLLACQDHFQAQDTDVLLITAPKSGTTCLKATLFDATPSSPHPKPSQPRALLKDSAIFATHLPYPLLPTSKITTRQLVKIIKKLNQLQEQDLIDLSNYAGIKIPEEFKVHECDGYANTSRPEAYLQAYLVRRMIQSYQSNLTGPALAVVHCKED